MDLAVYSKLENIYACYSQELERVVSHPEAAKELSQMWSKDFHNRIYACTVEGDATFSINLLMDFFKGAFTFLKDLSVDPTDNIYTLERRAHITLLEILSTPSKK